MSGDAKRKENSKNEGKNHARVTGNGKNTISMTATCMESPSLINS